MWDKSVLYINEEYVICVMDIVIFIFLWKYGLIVW